MILIEAILFVMPAAAHSFAKTHMPDAVRLVLGLGEMAGCILMLIPRTAIRGAWLLLGVFVLAILIHLLHASTASVIWPYTPPPHGRLRWARMDNHSTFEL
ncbi:MAG: DoxX family protein [Candidatus Sulfotelmatobacter sp.]